LVFRSPTVGRRHSGGTRADLGQFFAELSNHDITRSGNFKVVYLDNELAHVDRALYGGNVHYESMDTSSREARGSTARRRAGHRAHREELRGIGGSLYFLRQQDSAGSERVPSSCATAIRLVTASCSCSLVRL